VNESPGRQSDRRSDRQSDGAPDRLTHRLAEVSGAAEAQAIYDSLAPLEQAIQEDRELVAAAAELVAAVERTVMEHVAAALDAAEEEKDS